MHAQSQRARGPEGESRSARPWVPAPALQATAALHLGGVLALASMRADWRWIAGTLVANHGVLFAATMAPRSRVLGPNIVRLPKASAARGEIALTFDDGPDPDVTPQVLDLLDRHGAVGTFFCIGEHVAAHPALTREIVARGHAVESHSFHHSLGFGWYGPRRLRREVESSQRAIEDAAGVSPAFFRSPYGTRSPMLDPVLVRAGLRHVAWKRRGYDAVDPNAERVFRRLVSRMVSGDVLLLHDGTSASERSIEPTVLRVLPRLLRHLDQVGLRSVSLRAAFDVARAA